MAPLLPHTRRLAARTVSPFYRHQLYRWQWSEFDPSRTMPLPEGFELVRASEVDLPALEQIGAGFDRASDFLAAGHRLWLVRNGDRVAFSAWTFLGSGPSNATRTGWLALPEGTFNQEDSNTHPDFRGQGLAGAAGRAIFAELNRDMGLTRRVTYILDRNAASRRSAAKGGWREFALVDVTKLGLLRRDAGWRSRNGDGPWSLTRLRVQQASVIGGPSTADDEMYAWVRAAIKRGVPGPERRRRPTRTQVVPVRTGS